MTPSSHPGSCSSQSSPGLQYRSAPTAAALDSCTQPHRMQTARNIELLAGASPIGTRCEQRELLTEAKRLLETGELFPQGTAEEPNAPDAEAEASDSEPEAARDGATGRRSQQRQ